MSGNAGKSRRATSMRRSILRIRVTENVRETVTGRAGIEHDVMNGAKQPMAFVEIELNGPKYSFSHKSLLDKTRIALFAPEQNIDKLVGMSSEVADSDIDRPPKGRLGCAMAVLAERHWPSS
jgi:hypothetical protein